MRYRGSKYRKHSVTIVTVSTSRGRESTSETDVDDAYVGTIRSVVRDESGNHPVERTIVILSPETVITREDRVRVDGIEMPVKSITRPRFVGKSPNHLEVILD